MIGLIDTELRHIIYWTADPAIDPDESDIVAYTETLQADLLTLRGVATEFHVRALTKAEYDRAFARAMTPQPTQKKKRTLKKGARVEEQSVAQNAGGLLEDMFLAGCLEIRNLCAEGDSYSDMRALLGDRRKMLSPNAVIAIGAAIQNLTTSPMSEAPEHDEGK